MAAVQHHWSEVPPVSCAHCQAGDVSCCQCEGTGRVPGRTAEKSVRWAWEFAACRCAACQRLHRVRVALGWA